MKPSSSEKDNANYGLEQGLPSSMDAERAVLGAILLDNKCFAQTETLAVEYFSLDSHRRIYRVMLEMWQDGIVSDIITLCERLRCRQQLEAVGGYAYIASLTDGVPARANIEHYVHIINEKAQLRAIINSSNKAITRALEQDKPSDIIADLNTSSCEVAGWIQQSSGTPDWQTLFHTHEEIVNAPPLGFAITNFLQEDGVTLIAGPSGDGKTLMMLSMVRSLLTGSPLFGYSQFTVPTLAERVIYLIPEASIRPFGHRLKLFRLEKYVESRKLWVRTLSSKKPMSLTDPAFLRAAEGAHVFLDTAVRFMEGDENASNESNVFAQTLFQIQAAGAKTITGAHHSPKSFDNADYMTLENVVRGSGDIGAMLATCWGIKQIDASNTSIFVQNVKSRDFEACQPFIIQGRPHIDDHGTFLMKAEPGEAGELKDNQNRHRPGCRQKADTPEKKQQVFTLVDRGMSYQEISNTLDVPKSTVGKWVKELRETQDTKSTGGNL